jgi:hypothetical protein
MDRLAAAIYASMGRLLLVALSVTIAAAAAGGMDSVRALAAIGGFWLFLEVCCVETGSRRP